MKLLSVNVGRPREIAGDGRTVRTGIFKCPVEGRVMMRTLNLDGDGQADLRVHGGPDKAVYAYPFEHYAYWMAELGRDDLSHGRFGENLTVEGMLEDGVHVGDAFRIGEALVQVTQPREPCFKLGLRMGEPAILRPFLESGRVGFYLRVLREGTVGAGDRVERTGVDPARLTVGEVLRLRHAERPDAGAIERVLGVAALSESWRRSFEQLRRRNA